MRRLHMIDEQNKPIALPLQYVYWLWDTVRGDFGQSVQYHEKVETLIWQRLPTTLALNLLSAVIIYLIAVPAGILTAARRGTAIDSAWSVGAVALYSLPAMWVGALLIGYLANPQNFALFPSAGLHRIDTERYTSIDYAMDYLWHLVLPLVVYTYGGFAYLSKLMRGSMLETMNLDFSRTARAKGLPKLVVLLRHDFRNSLLPLITTMSALLPGLLGGSLIVEQLFSIRGMGDLAIRATDARDLPVIQGIAFVGSILSLLSLLITDILYAIADPRVSYE
jgi:ABC-type dipeptide/oligopeptide/nickel transport system permease component